MIALLLLLLPLACLAQNITTCPPPGCPEGSPCTVEQRNICESRRCTFDSRLSVFRCAAPSCSDGILNSWETSVDCGGNCRGCTDSSPCFSGEDCRSSVCLFRNAFSPIVEAGATGGACKTATCDDGVVNGIEADIDCGESACCSNYANRRECPFYCPNGFACTVTNDCESQRCFRSATLNARFCAATRISDTQPEYSTRIQASFRIMGPKKMTFDEMPIRNALAHYLDLPLDNVVMDAIIEVYRPREYGNTSYLDLRYKNGWKPNGIAYARLLTEIETHPRYQVVGGGLSTTIDGSEYLVGFKTGDGRKNSSVLNDFELRIKGRYGEEALSRYRSWVGYGTSIIPSPCLLSNNAAGCTELAARNLREEEKEWNSYRNKLRGNVATAMISPDFSRLDSFPSELLYSDGPYSESKDSAENAARKTQVIEIPRYNISTSDTAIGLEIHYMIYCSPFEADLMRSRMDNLLNHSLLPGGWTVERELEKEAEYFQQDLAYCLQYGLLNNTEVLNITGVDCIAHFDTAYGEDGYEIVAFNETYAEIFIGQSNCTLILDPITNSTFLRNCTGSSSSRRLDTFLSTDSSQQDFSSMPVKSVFVRPPILKSNVATGFRMLRADGSDLLHDRSVLSHVRARAASSPSFLALLRAYVTDPEVDAFLTQPRYTLDGGSYLDMFLQRTSGVAAPFPESGPRSLYSLSDLAVLSKELGHPPSLNLTLPRLTFPDLLSLYGLVFNTSAGLVTLSSAVIDPNSDPASNQRVPRSIIVIRDPRGTLARPLYTGERFTLQPIIEIRDRHNRAVTGFQGNVKVTALLSRDHFDAGMATLTGFASPSLHAASGRGFFDDLRLQQSVDGIFLNFTSSFIVAPGGSVGSSGVGSRVVVQGASREFNVTNAPPVVVIVVPRVPLHPAIVYTSSVFGAALVVGFCGFVVARMLRKMRTPLPRGDVYISAQVRERMERMARKMTTRRGYYDEDGNFVYDPNGDVVETVEDYGSTEPGFVANLHGLAFEEDGGFAYSRDSDPKNPNSASEHSSSSHGSLNLEADSFNVDGVAGGGKLAQQAEEARRALLQPRALNPTAVVGVGPSFGAAFDRLEAQLGDDSGFDHGTGRTDAHSSEFEGVMDDPDGKEHDFVDGNDEGLETSVKERVALYEIGVEPDVIAAAAAAQRKNDARKAEREAQRDEEKEIHLLPGATVNIPVGRIRHFMRYLIGGDVVANIGGDLATKREVQKAMRRTSMVEAGNIPSSNRVATNTNTNAITNTTTNTNTRANTNTNTNIRNSIGGPGVKVGPSGVLTSEQRRVLLSTAAVNANVGEDLVQGRRDSVNSSSASDPVINSSLNHALETRVKANLAPSVVLMHSGGFETASIVERARKRLQRERALEGADEMVLRVGEKDTDDTEAVHFLGPSVAWGGVEERALTDNHINTPDRRASGTVSTSGNFNRGTLNFSSPLQQADDDDEILPGGVRS